MVSTSCTTRTKCRWLWREFRREVSAAGIDGGERAESRRRRCSFAGVIVVSIRAEERGRSEDTDQLGAPRYDSVSETSGVAVELERRQMWKGRRRGSIPVLNYGECSSNVASVQAQVRWA